MDGLELAEPVHNGCQEGAHGDDEHTNGAPLRVRRSGRRSVRHSGRRSVRHSGRHSSSGAVAGVPAVLGVGQPAQDRQARGDGVGTRGEAFVRQGLPGGEHGDVGGWEVAGQGGGGLLRLPAGGGDDEQWSALAPACGGAVHGIGGMRDGGTRGAGDTGRPQ